LFFFKKNKNKKIKNKKRKFSGTHDVAMGLV
jgi:hypothetical protein